MTEQLYGCNQCKEQLPAEAFSLCRSPRGRGLQYTCKACNKLARKPYDLNRLYGMTMNDFHEMWDSHDGSCSICSAELSLGSAGYAIDHNHATGEVRGLLCPPCNTGLGLFKDNTETLSSAINYLNTKGSYGRQASPN